MLNMHILGIFFGLYDTLKQVLYHGESTMMMNWLLAQSVTTLAGYVCYPFDTVRRRLMMQSVWFYMCSYKMIRVK